MKTGKLFKKVLLAAVSAGSSLVIAACYGAFYGMQQIASGRVTHNGQGVRGMEVCAQYEHNPETCTTTDGNGYYVLQAEDMRYDDAYSNGFSIVVTDVDGEDNGGLFAQTSVDVDPQQAPETVDVDVELEPTP